MPVDPRLVELGARAIAGEFHEPGAADELCETCVDESRYVLEAVLPVLRERLVTAVAARLYQSHLAMQSTIDYREGRQPLAPPPLTEDVQREWLDHAGELVDRALQGGDT